MGAGASVSGKDDGHDETLLQTNMGSLGVKDFSKQKHDNEKSVSVRDSSKSVTEGRRKSQVVTNNFGKKKIVTWLENDEEGLFVGDVVKVTFATSEPLEGFVVERLNDVNIIVDFGDHTKECHVSNCTLIIRSDELEVGDKVEMKPEDSALYFVGKVIAINPDCTLDVQMDGDDPDDIERNVNVENIRKLMSRRGLAVSRWRKAFMMVIAINRFGGGDRRFGELEEEGKDSDQEPFDI